ncbi:hypothetical protein [Lentzea sp. NPDC060358]|uniref:hypothetical protein n=1 Tax=Lentzea sp. NPDC060358 TaxID=3347103 RepID=UPI00365D4B37
MESPLPIRDNDEALVDVGTSAPLRVAGTVLLRRGLVDRLVTAQSLLPRAVRLFLVAGHRATDSSCAAQTAHRTGGAVDLTLSGGGPDQDAPPLPDCWADPVALPPEKVRALLTSALSSAGLVNDPARWWHWSYGDRFWAHVTNAPYARYGPVPG